MSLVIALHESADRYALAADTRVSTHIVHIARTASKVFQRGDWYGGWCGTTAVAQAFVRALGELGDTRESVEAALIAAWTTTMASHGQRPADGSPFVDVDLLLVGPPGIARFAAHGSLTWEEGLGVIGCADEYVTGWFDREPEAAEAMPMADRLRDVMEAAAHRYPGVGAPFDVIERG